MVMKEVHGIVEGCSHVKSGGCAVVCVGLKGPYVDLS